MLSYVKVLKRVKHFGEQMKIESMIEGKSSLLHTVKIVSSWIE